MAAALQIKDSRGYFVLPQQPEDAGYYTYGTPGGGQGQFTHPKLMSFLFNVANQWSAIDNRLIGIGNISLADGAKFIPHHGHLSGLEVDIRLMRKDGKKEAVTRFDPQYDREGTKKLVQLLWSTGQIKRVRFNDLSIPRVVFTPGHDNHLHVDI